MKMLMSICDKFFNLSPKDLIDTVERNDVYRKVDGFEISIDFHNNDQLKYLEDFILLCFRKNYIIQIHGDSSLTLEEQFSFMNKIFSITSDFDYPVLFVFHPLMIENDRSVSKYETQVYMEEILKYISLKKYNFVITIENLNDRPRVHRLIKEELVEIFGNIESLRFTYDIGHDIYDGGNILSINPLLVERLSNVHLHTFNSGFDHMPIFNRDEYKKYWVKAIQLLKYWEYEDRIVFEYDLFKVPGENMEERIYNYIKSIEFIKEYF